MQPLQLGACLLQPFCVHLLQTEPGTALRALRGHRDCCCPSQAPGQGQGLRGHSCRGREVVLASLQMPRSEGAAQGVPVPSPAPAGAPCLEPRGGGWGRSGWHLCGLVCWDLGERGGQRWCPDWHPPRAGREGLGWARVQGVQLCLPVCRVWTSELSSDTFVASWHLPSSRRLQQVLAQPCQAGGRQEQILGT